MYAALHDAARAEAKPAPWSNGVKHARADCVVESARDDKEITLRVKPPGRTVAFTVNVSPTDAIWECTCDAHFDPCEHSCAAIIALYTAEKEGRSLKTAAEAFARVGYVLRRAPQGVTVSRLLLWPDGREEPLTSAKGLLADETVRHRVQLEEHDLLMDKLLERPAPGVMPTERLMPMLTALEPCRTVTLDGRPIAVAKEVILPKVRVEDAEGGGVSATIVSDERVTAVVSAGVALCGDSLHRLGETSLSGDWLERLPQTKQYAQVGELTTRVLPELARRFPLEVRTKRVPRLDATLEPRVQLELNHVEQGLSVLPTLVYGSPPTARIDNGTLVHLRGALPVRDEAKEARVLQRARELLDVVPGRRVTFAGPDITRFVDGLKRFEGSLAGDGARRLAQAVTLVPMISTTSVAGAGLAIDATVTFRVEGGAGGTIDAADVLRAWQQGLGLVPLASGGWAALPQAFLDVHGQRLADLLAARRADGRLANHALPRLQELCEALETPAPLGLDKLAPLVDGFETLPEAIAPEGLMNTLRPYQQHGFRWLHFLAEAGLGGVLADDMGLGKTLQTIAAIRPPALVVCPTSVLPNWQAELKRFRPGLSVNVFHGAGRALNGADVTLTSYAVLRLDELALGQRDWAHVVLDEAQAIKNPDSQTAKAAFALKGQARLALSGTPVENRLTELWSVMHFANPGLLGGRRAFDDRWAGPIADGKRDVAQALRGKLKPFVLRRLKRDVAPELPPKSESVLYVQLDVSERAVYDAVYAATRADVMKRLGEGQNVMQVLEALLRLRQAACHTALVPGQQALSSSKLDALLEALSTAAADGHKALVFSQWTGLLDLVEPKLKAAGIAFTRLDGSTQDRGAVTQKFQADDGPPVLLASLKAGGVGLNLTAADSVFLLDPWWNPAAEQQAADRAYRIGQTRPVSVYRLVSQGTVEEKILSLQEQKRALFEAALGDGGAAGGISRDDLLQLFD
jgi:superfamily II DNA or RNA helicase